MLLGSKRALLGSASWRPAIYANFAAAGEVSTPAWIDNSGTTGNRMYYDSTGTLTWAPANEILYSQDFTPGSVTPGRPWIVDNGGAFDPVVTVDAGVAPDGTTTADRIVFNRTGGSFSRIRQNVTTIADRKYLCSVYMKTYSGGTANVGLRLDGNGINCAVTSTWQRFDLGITSASTIVIVQLLLFSAIPGNDVTADVLVWGAQLEPITYQTSPRTYIPTTTAAVYQPRYDYDPSVTPAIPRGMLIEESRSNFVTYSEQFNNAAWGKTSAGTGSIPVITPDQVIAPDGTQTADLAVFNAGANGAGDYSLLEGPTFGATAQPYTFSIWLKTSDASTKTVNLSISGAASSVVTVTGTWQRFSTTWNASAGAWNPRILVGLGTTSATASLYVWGAQVEDGAFYTSYFSTITIPLTRVPDIVKWTTAAFTSYWNASAGTIVLEAFIPTDVDGASGNYYVTASDGTVSNMISIADVSGSNFLIINGGSVVFNQTVGSEPTSAVRTAFAFTNNNSNCAANGVLGTLSTSISIPAVTSVDIGRRGDGNSITYANGWIRSFAYYNKRLPDPILRQKSIVGSSY